MLVSPLLTAQDQLGRTYDDNVLAHNLDLGFSEVLEGSHGGDGGAVEQVALVVQKMHVDYYAPYLLAERQFSVVVSSSRTLRRTFCPATRHNASLSTASDRLSVFSSSLAISTSSSDDLCAGVLSLCSHRNKRELAGIPPSFKEGRRHRRDLCVHVEKAFVRSVRPGWNELCRHLRCDSARSSSSSSATEQELVLCEEDPAHLDLPSEHSHHPSSRPNDNLTSLSSSGTRPSSLTPFRNAVSRKSCSDVDGSGSRGIVA